MRDDTRGQVVQIAALLALAIAVIAFAGYQASVVPQETAASEQDHFEQTTSDLKKLQTSIERTARSGQPDSTSVRMAPRYQSRFLAINPSRGSGTLENEQRPDGIVIENAVADGETGDYWGGSETTFDTSRIVYRPSYDQFEDQPTRVYESSVRYDAFESGGTVVRSGQSLIRGDEIRLTAIQGDLQKSGPEARQVDTRPLSAPAETVTVSGDNDDPVVIEVPTELSEETWEDLLEAEIEDGNIESEDSVTVEDDVLSVELDGSVEYDLRLGAVGVGEKAEEPEAEYIVDVRGDGVRIPEGSRLGIVAEVRDEYDNAFAGQVVAANVEQNLFEEDSEDLDSDDDPPKVEPDERLSSDDGTAGFIFEAPDVEGDEETFTVLTDIEDDDLIEFVECDPGCEFDLENPERVAEFEITVVGSGEPDSGLVPFVDNVRIAMSDQQTISFDLEEELPEDETVSIDFSDAQNTQGGRPDPVDYQSVEINEEESDLQGGEVTRDIDGNSAEFVYEPSGDTTGEITIVFDNVETQLDPESDLSVQFDRTDTDETDAEETFDVIEVDEAPVELLEIEVGNLEENEDGQTQEFAFEFDDQPHVDSRVTIDLREANGRGPGVVNYGDIEDNVEVLSGDGTVSAEESFGQDIAEIIYTVGEQDEPNQTIRIEADEIDTGAQSADEYQVTFIHLGKTYRVTFDVEGNGPGGGPP